MPERCPGERQRVRSFKTSDAEWAAYREAARLDGMKLSAWIRKHLDRARKRAEKRAARD